MNDPSFVLLIFFASLCIAGLVVLSRRREAMTQFPFLVTAVFAGWILPQLLGLALNGNAPLVAVYKAILFASMCLVACWIGYRSGAVRQKRYYSEYSYSALTVYAIFLAVIGLYFSVQVRGLATQATEAYGGAWTGIITIYVLLASLVNVALAICLVVSLKQYRPLVLIVAVSCIAIIAERAFIQGRREQAVELFLMVAIFLWIRYRYVPPRSAVLAIIAAGTLFVSNIGDYRRVFLSDNGANVLERPTLDQLADIDYLDNYVKAVKDPSRNQEILNAALSIEATDRRFSFDGGLSLWNDFVHNYIPGQILGRKFKEGLLLPFSQLELQEFGHRPHTGTTYTGLSDSFRSFWWLGCLKFFAIGWLMRKINDGASSGTVWLRITLMLIAADSLLAVTHSTHHFFLEFVAVAAFVLPGLFISKRRGQRSAKTVEILAGSRYNRRATSASLSTTGLGKC